MLFFDIFRKRNHNYETKEASYLTATMVEFIFVFVPIHGATL